MNYIYTLIFLFLYSITTYAQVGIGTTNPQAALDISSDTKGGILIPRYSLSGNNDLSTVVNPQPLSSLPVSTLIYNITAVTGANALPQGFVYWNGTIWVPLTPSSMGGGDSNSWNLNGNSVGINNFLGTTNYQALNFRVNNRNVGLLHPGGGLALGMGAIANNNNSIAIGTSASASISNQAVAIGPEANASGFQSAAFGYKSSATTNSALAFGINSLASGQTSIALGGDSKASGLNSTAVGKGSSATSENSTALGNGAVANQRNAVVIGDVANANVGIGTSTPNINVKLDVNGDFKLGNKGTIQKNIISFSQGLNLGTIEPNGSVILTFNIPLNMQPATVAASLIVTPENSMPDNLSIAWTKLNGTQSIRVKLINTSAQTYNNPYNKFYITIIEFKEY